MSKEAKQKLEPLLVNIEERSVKTGDVLRLKVVGDYPEQYNVAAGTQKSAGELMEQLKEAMVPVVMRHLFHYNESAPQEPSASVAIEDKEGNTTRLTLSSKFGAIDQAVVEALFKLIRKQDGGVPDINDYFAHNIEAEFDASAFNVDGKFDQDRYQQFMGALDEVSKNLKINNPLSIKRSVKPVPTFGITRWRDFDASTNFRIFKAVPNQVTCTPCPKVIKLA